MRRADGLKMAANYRRRLDEIARIIEDVDNRCLAVDGPVSKTLDEMTDQEMCEIYKLAKIEKRGKCRTSR